MCAGAGDASLSGLGVVNFGSLMFLWMCQSPYRLRSDFLVSAKPIGLN